MVIHCVKRFLQLTHLFGLIRKQLTSKRVRLLLPVIVHVFQLTMRYGSSKKNSPTMKVELKPIYIINFSECSYFVVYSRVVYRSVQDLHFPAYRKVSINSSESDAQPLRVALNSCHRPHVKWSPHSCVFWLKTQKYSAS